MLYSPKSTNINQETQRVIIIDIRDVVYCSDFRELRSHTVNYLATTSKCFKNNSDAAAFLVICNSNLQYRLENLQEYDYKLNYNKFIKDQNIITLDTAKRAHQHINLKDIYLPVYLYSEEIQATTHALATKLRFDTTVDTFCCADPTRPIGRRMDEMQQLLSNAHFKNMILHYMLFITTLTTKAL